MSSALVQTFGQNSPTLTKHISKGFIGHPALNAMEVGEYSCLLATSSLEERYIPPHKRKNVLVMPLHINPRDGQ